MILAASVTMIVPAHMHARTRGASLCVVLITNPVAGNQSVKVSTTKQCASVLQALEETLTLNVLQLAACRMMRVPTSVAALTRSASARVFTTRVWTRPNAKSKVMRLPAHVLLDSTGQLTMDVKNVSVFTVQVISFLYNKFIGLLLFFDTNYCFCIAQIFRFIQNVSYFLNSCRWLSCGCRMSIAVGVRERQMRRPLRAGPMRKIRGMSRGRHAAHPPRGLRVLAGIPGRCCGSLLPRYSCRLGILIPGYSCYLGNIFTRVIMLPGHFCYPGILANQLFPVADLSDIRIKLHQGRQ
jgi:hypothetical protein